MKLINILMVVVFSIPLNFVFAQKDTAGYDQSNSTRSKKELMKMEVIKRENTPKNYSANDKRNRLAVTLSLKEQMKNSVIKKNTTSPSNSIANTKFRKCSSCIRLSSLSSKEQMKMQVMGIKSNTNDTNKLKENLDKCSRCGADL